MKCQDILTIPILEFVASKDHWCNWYFGDDYDVRKVMPTGVSPKLVLAKMGKLIRRGYLSGCDCGCRGDYEITEKGIEEIKKSHPETIAGRIV